MQNDLDPKGLAAAKVAFNEAVNNPRMVPCPKCDGRGFHHGFGEDGASPDWCLACGGNQYDIVPGEEDRALIDAIRAYLTAVPAGDGELVERLLMTAVDMERKFLHRIDHSGEDWKLVNPNGETAAALLREAASRLSQGTGVTDAEVQRLTEENEGLRAKNAVLDADGIAARRATAKHYARIKALEEALTPSGETKAAFIGEFSFPHEQWNVEGDDTETVQITVPWTTIKEIMVAIRSRSALSGDTL